MSSGLTIKQLGKDSLVYGIGGVMAKATGFLLLPVYTRIFSVEEYGTIEMMVVVSSLLSALLAMGTDSALSYFFFQKKQSGKLEQKKIVSAVLQWKIAWGGILVAVATLASPYLNYLLFGGNLQWKYFAIAFSGALFTQVMQQSAEVCRLLYRPWPFIILISSQSIISGVLIILLAIYFEQGVFGYFLGVTIASVVMALIGWTVVREYIDLKRLYFHLWPKLLRFGVPLMPAGIAMYAMNTTDRWFLQYYHGQESIGYYAVAAKLVMLLSFAIETFRKAWWPIAMDAIHGNENPETFRTISRLFMGVGVASVTYLTFLSPWLMKLMTAEIFHSSYDVVGVLAWSSLFYGFYMVVVAGIWKSEKTKYISICMLFAAMLNAFLNYLLVPKYGIMGAAMATSIVFFAWCAVILFISEKFWFVGYPVHILGAQIVTGVVSITWILYAYKHQFPTYYIAIISHAICFMLLLSSLNINQVQLAMKKLIKI